MLSKNRYVSVKIRDSELKEKISIRDKEDFLHYFIYYQAQDVMTPDPITVNLGDTLEKVEQIFEEHALNGVPVVDEKNRLLGVITKLDLLKVSRPANNNRIPLYPAIMGESVSKVMTEKPAVVRPETSLSTVIEVMIEKKYKSLPVVENHRVIGIIARENILVALHKASKGMIPARLIAPEKRGLLEPDRIQDNHSENPHQVK
jgi:CBS domain-containing protein